MARLLPRVSEMTRPFWSGGADKQLLIMRCRQCSGFIHPPRPVCRHCLSDDVGPEPVSGRGVVDTFTINYQPWTPELGAPYVIARVALDDAPGVFLTTNVIGCPPESVEIGDRVQVVFEPCGEVYLPLFRKVD